jgi:hypothetical protein
VKQSPADRDRSLGIQAGLCYNEGAPDGYAAGNNRTHPPGFCAKPS